jgi:type 1 glutamine amidotransferase
MEVNLPILKIAWMTLLCAGAGLAAPHKIVLIAGTQSHATRTHEYNAGCALLAKFLKQNHVPDPVVVTGGWPEDESVFEGARAIVLYMDGWEHHPLLQGDRMDKLGALIKKGTGLACLHYAVELPKQSGGLKLLDWLGGFYDRPYSQNPMNDAVLEQASPRHPISRGWKPFTLRDEWYFRIRFQPGDRRVTPVLTAMLPPSHPEKQVLAWATERADGGRSFGFTGLHFHKNWDVPEFRRLLVNAVLWAAKLNVPKGGARCDLDAGDLDKNLFVIKPKR